MCSRHRLMCAARRREEHISTCGSRTEDTFTPGLHNIPTPRAEPELALPPLPLRSLYLSLASKQPPTFLPALRHLPSPPGIILFPHHNSAHIGLSLSATQPCPLEPTTGESFCWQMTLLCGRKTLLFELLIQRRATTVSVIKSELF